MDLPIKKYLKENYINKKDLEKILLEYGTKPINTENSILFFTQIQKLIKEKK